MLSEVEAIQELYDPVLVRVFVENIFKQICLGSPVFSILFFVLANFDGDWPPTVSHVFASHYLSESPCVNLLFDQVAVAKLFTFMNIVIALFI